MNRLSPYLDMARQRFDQLAEKDQKALMALAAFLVIVMFWLLIWRPLDQWADREYDELVLERETQEFIAANYERTRSLVKNQSAAPKKDAAAVIASSGRKAGLELARVQPARQGVSIWIDEAPYQKLLGWLIELHNKENLEVRQIRVERTDQDGMVKAFLRLSR
ncbi:type II secretion system protein M [Sansalvadorimonas sp. 2012CJ34-2]|uniref:Type II secretion system protein M n=1 Tax=Parendozoicomonas callyspongiae TaxID=2942213 RepID=A0ABT0PIF0_9GAMM|nr:type II secretion system protein M [Sansalvadorimonas sp. 2012CJ34-2]MCL6271149.1 type II secretion system protein M [Sansalvadorimonas sp. 2012CJ34-2]